MEASLAPTIPDTRAETPSGGQVASHVSPTSAATAGSPPALSPAAEQFANRLRKNARRWGRYMRRAGTTCYRVYDADLPDFAVAIDIYERWVHVQEYAPPPEIEEAKAADRLAEAMRVIPDVLGVESADVFLKVRARQRGAAQYARQAAQGIEQEVHEDDLVFLVNFTDYLDTGLFLSGREVRRLLGELAPGQRFLNLFGYTGTASVAAGRGGATSTTTVDLNAGYLEWAQRNLARNKLKPARNAVVEADVLQWVGQTDERFGLIYLDPPTFSNSKKMGRATFDVRRDHADLIRLVTRRLLAPGGVLMFACNARRFSMDTDTLTRDHLLSDLSRATLPPDFARSARAHHTWRITVRE
jgi:23S rRNA (guanine2445-N2)-methyltransferase / 23S rRNA (guanine2069-N7)-methyltransferase